jgi:hypothetical protein
MSHYSRTLALCGAGPSLRDDVIRGVDDVWACNSALPYLIANGATVTAAIGIDQTPGLLREWSDPPDVTYYVASSVDPDLVSHLRSHDRRVVFFHNHVGFAADEFDHYAATWPPTLMVGEGFSVVSRALGLATWLGYERVDIYGADCCFGPDDVTHANGDTAITAYGKPVVMQSYLGGRKWRTRADMLMDAVHLVRRVRKSDGHVRLMGDTFPVFLLGKDDTTLDLVCKRYQPGDPLPAPDLIPAA